MGFAVSRKERLIIRRKAKEKGMPLSKYLREVALLGETDGVLQAWKTAK